MFLLVPAYPGSPGTKAVKLNTEDAMCVCVVWVQSIGMSVCLSVSLPKNQMSKRFASFWWPYLSQSSGDDKLCTSVNDVMFVSSWPGKGVTSRACTHRDSPGAKLDVYECIL